MKANVTNSPFRINREELLIFLLCFPLIKPESVDYAFSYLGTIYNLARVLSFCGLILLYVLRRKKPSPIVWLITALQCWVVLTTYLNNGDIRRAFMVMISSVAILLLVDLFIEKPKKLIRAVFCNFEWIMYVNLFTIMLMPNGLYNHGAHEEFICYFLGFKNSFFAFCIVSVFLSTLNLFYDKRILRSILLIIVSVLNVFFVWSASSIVALSVTTLMIVYLVVFKKGLFFEKISLRSIYLISLIINLLLSVFNFVENSPFLSDIIVNVLHKGTTLSGRTVIWGIALKMISEKPIVGYGIGEHITWAGYNWYGHNQYIQLLMEGGVIGLLLFMFVMVALIKKTSRLRNVFAYKLMLASLTGLFIFYLAEAGTSYVFYMLFIMAYNIDKFKDMNGNRITYKYIRSGN